ncbi:MAG: hypothetical protein EBU82_12375, partial [Flavobacteriia bacterium]|nr:hypothetical protein [Flavobacteriia bacterium]
KEEKPPVAAVVESPTIVVDTEPSVRFTNIDTIFHPSDPQQHTFKPTSNPEDDHIEFVDDSEVPMDSFEELGEEIDDFETL